MNNTIQIIEIFDSEHDEQWHSSSNISLLKEGYEIERFVDPPRKDFQCPICLGVVRCPLECSQCGILLCKKCACGCSKPSNPFLSLTSAIPKFNCPICRSRAPPHEPSAILQKILSSLLVFCKNKPQSCQETFPISEIKGHEKICQYKVIRCANHNFCNTQGNKLSFIEVEFPKEPKTGRVGKNKLVCSEVCKKVVLMDFMLKSGQIEQATKAYKEALDEVEEI